jgi:hypothetical protein
MLRTPDLAGRALDDRYELHAAIGEGAFGRVYEGLDRRLARTVAVKVIKPWWAEDSAWVERFQREAQMLARVSDPGIVQIFDFGHAEEGPYYVAELVQGESLAERLTRGALPPAQARAVAEQLCRALGSAHEQGIVHCDVKPANVMLTPEGLVKVGDFGVARLAEGTSQALTATIAGTPRYMSPEQARGRPTTPATDVYSAGVVLYEMLSGSPPFASGSAVELGLSHVQDPPPRLPAGIPAALCEVVDRALAKDPDARYRDGAAMAAALREAGTAGGDGDGHGAGAIAAPSAARAAGSMAAPAAARGPAAEEARAAAKGPERAGVQRRTPRKAPADEVAATSVIGEPPTIDLAASSAASRAHTSVLRRSSSPPPPPPPGDPGRRDHASAHRRRRLALLAGVLVVAAGVLLAVLLSGAGATTTVPQLLGLPAGGVQARAQRMHVRPVFSKRYSGARAGLAIAQSPAPGAHVAQGSTVNVVLSAGPPPVKVPGVVGQQASAAEGTLVSSGLRYHEAMEAVPGAAAGQVLHQTPAAEATVPRGTTVTLSVAEAPRWRPLTSFSGVDDGHSVPFRIRGSEWRVSYSMSYQGTCLLIVTCFGPSASAVNLQSSSTVDSFDLGEGSSETHTFKSGPGLYRLDIKGGQDSAQWSMAVEDHY